MSSQCRVSHRVVGAYSARPRPRASRPPWAKTSWVRPSDPALGHRVVQGGAEVAHLHEVVEVAGLEAGVLAVVGEGQQLLRDVGLGPSRRYRRIERDSMVVAVERPSSPRVVSFEMSVWS